MVKLIGYIDENCINCGRLRVELWDNGLKLCEKCNFDQDKQEYSISPWDIENEEYYFDSWVFKNKNGLDTRV